MRLDRGQIEVLDDQMADILRSKTVAERLAIADQMWMFARQLIASTLRSEHPDWDARRLEREIARRLSHGAV